MPLKKPHLRKQPVKPQRAVYPRGWRRLQSRLGSARTAPLSWTHGTGRWFRRCPEDLCISVKSFEGSMLLELQHLLRRPYRWEPISRAGNRVPDFVRPHTPSYRYNLDLDSHNHAFWHLLNHSTSYVAGAKNPDYRFRNLYRLDINETREIARWDIDGLWRYDERKRTSVPATRGQEVLEAVCLPGERPRKPKILCSAEPDPQQKPKEWKRYQREYEHWKKQVSSCRNKRVQLRVRRVDADHKDHPSFFLNDCFELDLTFRAIEHIAMEFPAWWKFVYGIYRKQGNKDWAMYRDPDVPNTYIPVRNYTPAKFCMTKEDAKAERTPIRDAVYNAQKDRLVLVTQQPKFLEGMAHEHRQRRWQPEVVANYLAPWFVAEACEMDPQPGLFLLGALGRDASDRQLLQARLALWSAHLLRWDPHAELDAIEAMKELQTDYSVVTQQLLQAILIVWAIQTIRRQRDPYEGKVVRLTRQDIYHAAKLARGPPR